jgi:hypothetical protein
MNGLTAASVDELFDAINIMHTNCCALRKFEAAHALAEVLFVMNRLREESTTQASRPDRVGDECWCGTYEKNVGWSWRRGILRAWAAGDCPAIVEDAVTKEIDYFSRISFATEAPQ